MVFTFWWEVLPDVTEQNRNQDKSFLLHFPIWNFPFYEQDLIQHGNSQFSLSLVWHTKHVSCKQLMHKMLRYKSLNYRYFPDNIATQINLIVPVCRRMHESSPQSLWTFPYIKMCMLQEKSSEHYENSSICHCNKLWLSLIPHAADKYGKFPTLCSDHSQSVQCILTKKRNLILDSILIQGAYQYVNKKSPKGFCQLVFNHKLIVIRPGYSH